MKKIGSVSGISVANVEARHTPNFKTKLIKMVQWIQYARIDTLIKVMTCPVTLDLALVYYSYIVFLYLNIVWPTVGELRSFSVVTVCVYA